MTGVMAILVMRDNLPPREPAPPPIGPIGQPQPAPPAWLRRWGPWLGLVALCCALFLPGVFNLPPFDRDEARFAQASRQMIESGDYIRIQFQHEPRNKKPAGVYWLQAASAQLFGGETAPIWAYRLPSFFAATGAVLALFAFGRRVMEPRTAFLAASLLASSLLMMAEARLAKTDAALLASILVAQMILLRVYFDARAGKPPPDRLLAYGFWAAIGCGLLIKGPVAPLPSLFTVLALWACDRSAAWVKGLRPLSGVPLALAIVAPWFLATTLFTDQNFVGDAVKGDLLPKLIGGQESHGAPPGLYLALAMATFFPASVFLLPALARGWWARRDPLERFALAWLIPTWVFFELLPTKLPHYVLPAYPALAILAARLIDAGGETVDRLSHWSARVGFGVWGLLLLVFCAGTVAFAWRFDPNFVPALLLPAGLAAAVGLFALRCLWLGDVARGLTFAIAASGLIFALIFQAAAPRAEAFWLSRSAAALVAQHRPDPGIPVASAGYTEPSLVFLLGTKTVLGDGEKAARHLAATPKALALVAQDHDVRFRQTLETLEKKATTLGEASGFNYSKGKAQTLTLYRLAE